VIRQPHADRALNVAIIQAALVLGAVIGIEAYLRQHETYLVSRTGTTLPRLVLASDDLIANTLRGRRLIPNAHVIVRHHQISGIDNIPIDINRFGYRGPEIPQKKGPGEFRILVLGDSITWADYLPEEQGYVRRLESRLRDAADTERITVINGGIGDVGTKEEVDILEEQGLRLSPDVVVVEWYLNDSRPPWGFAGELGGRGWLRRHSLVAEKAYMALHLYRWLGENGTDRLRWGRTSQILAWANRRDAFLQLARDAAFDWGAAWSPESWAVVDTQFARLRALADRHGFDVAVVAFPVSYQVYAGFVEDTPQRELRSRAAAFGFQFLDLLPLLRGWPHLHWQARAFGDDEVYFDQCHLRIAANDVVAQEIASFLRDAPLRRRWPRAAGE
jgi:lysophospholipase L1-like esterase